MRHHRMLKSSSQRGSSTLELAIVSPIFLALMMVGFHWAHTGRYLASVEYTGALQAWYEADRLNAGEHPIAKPDNTFRNAQGERFDQAMRDIPNRIGASARTGEIYAHDVERGSHGTPLGTLRLEEATMVSAPLNPVYMGLSSDHRFRNADVYGIVEATLNMPIAGNEPASQTRLRRIDRSTRQVIINDPHSVYWGHLDQRLRNVDRLTIMKDREFQQAAITQTIISGGVGILNDLDQMSADFGFPVFPDHEAYSAQARVNRLRLLSTGLMRTREQATPLRKVDKRMDHAHDTGGDTDEWGRFLPEHHQLRETPIQWSRYQ